MSIAERMKIVLVAPSHPGNIGATARAMKTMGLSQLVLVEPKSFPDPQATTMASNADDILAQATVVSTVSEALAGCELVFGTSARERAIEWPLLDARTGMEKAVEYLQMHDTATVALMFGRERTGLTNDELRRCHYHINIPTASEYQSLNLAAAVQVLSYEFRMANADQHHQKKVSDSPLAKAEELEQFYQHLEQALLAVGFLNPKAPKQVMPRLRRLFQRAQCDAVEVSILRGLCSKIVQFGQEHDKAHLS